MIKREEAQPGDQFCHSFVAYYELFLLHCGGLYLNTACTPSIPRGSFLRWLPPSIHDSEPRKQIPKGSRHGAHALGSLRARKGKRGAIGHRGGRAVRSGGLDGRKKATQARLRKGRSVFQPPIHKCPRVVESGAEISDEVQLGSLQKTTAERRTANWARLSDPTTSDAVAAAQGRDTQKDCLSLPSSSGAKQCRRGETTRRVYAKQEAPLWVPAHVLRTKGEQHGAKGA